MSFHKRRLPGRDELERLYKEEGKEGLAIYLKADVLIGPKESLDFISEIFDGPTKVDLELVSNSLAAVLIEVKKEPLLTKEAEDLEEVTKRIITKIK